MSNYTPDEVNGTLVASTVTTVDLAGSIHAISVFNRDGADEIWWTMNDSANGGTAPVPTVAGVDQYFIPATKAVGFASFSAPLGNVQIKLISAGTPTYAVVADQF